MDEVKRMERVIIVTIAVLILLSLILIGLIGYVGPRECGEGEHVVKTPVFAGKVMYFLSTCRED